MLQGGSSSTSDLAADVEERLVAVIRQMVTCRWHQQQQHHQHSNSDDDPNWYYEDDSNSNSNSNSNQNNSPKHNGMNLLHLAASAGLLRVTCALLNWRLENSSPHLHRQMDPLAADAMHGYTPLMWACANGHRDVVALLAQWQPAALESVDKCGRSAALVARQRAHHMLADELESRSILSVVRSYYPGRGSWSWAAATAATAAATAAAPNPTAEPLLDAQQVPRQMLLAKRSSVDGISSQMNNGSSNSRSHRTL